MIIRDLNLKIKLLKFSVWVCIFFLFAVLIFGSGFIIGRITVNSVRIPYLESSNPKLSDLLKPFFQTWDLVHEQYIDQPVTDVDLVQGSIKGLMQSLGDPHSTYMSPDQYRQFNAPLEGKYTGIGVWIDSSKDYLTIDGLMPGSPAEKAGILPGDIVTAVDSKDMTGLHPELVLRQIQGPAGTNETLTLVRKGELKPITVIVTREVINIPAVKSELINGKVAYIHLIQFSQNADNEFRKAFLELQKSKPVGLILDLRDNPGGFVETALQITSEFINQGNILIEESGDGSRHYYPSRGNGIALNIPLVVLINQNSASAAEITAGAIQDHLRASLVGTTTYGKGSVQNWIPLLGDNGAIRISVARWLTPNGRQINKNGLSPDFFVEITNDDVKRGKDPQRDAAIQLLTDK